MSNPIVSLCMPTNGVVHWVFRALESIENQNVPDELYEVVITDNGNNKEFKKRIIEYVAKHNNIVYAETDALPFTNEIECYKRASGTLIKFVNHRTLFLEGTLQKFIDFAKANKKEKPIVFFSDGALDKLSKSQHIYDSFDMFVRKLSYFSSWSMGMTIWKEDFEKLPVDISNYNELFPHMNVLFSERKREKYIIDNSRIFDDQPQGKTPKATYDLFGAFGVEYPAIILELRRSGDISSDTFRILRKETLGYIVELYWIYFIKKAYCSYNLTGIKDMYGVFYSKSEVMWGVFIRVITAVPRKIFRMLRDATKQRRDR